MKRLRKIEFFKYPINISTLYMKNHADIYVWLADRQYQHKYVIDSINYEFYIKFLTVDIHDHFEHDWIDNIDTVSPISPKFENNIVFCQGLISMNFYNFKLQLENSLGPEYENWHMYYTYGFRNLSFRTYDYEVQFKIIKDGLLHHA